MNKQETPRQPGPRGKAGKVTESAAAKMNRKEYEHELKRLQAELCYLQEWVKEPR